MSKESGRTLWTLDEQQIVTRPEPKLCHDIKDQMTQHAWDAPRKELVCGYYELSTVNAELGTCVESDPFR